MIPINRYTLMLVPLMFGVACSGGASGGGSSTPSVTSPVGPGVTVTVAPNGYPSSSATATPPGATPAPPGATPAPPGVTPAPPGSHPTATPASTATPVGATPRPSTAPTAIPTGSASTSNVATYAGCSIFTAGDWYNADVTDAPVDANSSGYIASLGARASGIFYASLGIEQVNLATPVTPLYAIAPKVSYHSFSAPEPWSSGFFIEPASDAHSIVLEVSPPACRLYELYETSFNGSVLSAYSGVHYDLSKAFTVLPAGTPSSMASGLSLFAGMVKYEELAGGIHHALNITVPSGSLCECFVAPASGDDGVPYAGTNAYQTPYGAHLRLKASFDDSGFGPQAQAIAEAMKHYGVFIADTSSSGNAVYTSNPLHGGAWDQNDLNALGSISIADFDVLATGQATQRRSGR